MFFESQSPKLYATVARTFYPPLQIFSTKFSLLSQLFHRPLKKMAQKGAASASAFVLNLRGIMTKSSCKSGNATYLLSVSCSNIHNFACHNTTFSPKPMIDFTRVNELDDALSLFKQLIRLRPQPSVRIYNKLLSGIAKMKHFSVAISMFDEMRQTGAPANEFTMNILIDCCCLMNRMEFGFALLASFYKRGYKPDATTFSTLIKGLFLGHRVAEAERLFKRILILKLCEPSDVIILTVINGLCKAGVTATAYELLQRLERTRWKPGVKAYNAVIDALCKRGMLDNAFGLLSVMIERGISPIVSTYNPIIQGLCDVGRRKEVKDLLNEMASSGISLSVVTFTIVVDSFCKEGKVEDAEDVIEIMTRQDIGLDVVACNALIDGYCLQGKMKKAEEVFDSIASRGLKPSVISYNSLINGYCKKGKMNRAWGIFLEIPNKGLKPTAATYNTMIHGLFHEGRFEDGWKLFNDMEARQVLPDLNTYSILLDNLCRTRRIAEAFSLLDVMKEKGFAPDTITYGTLIHGLCRAGKLDTALDIFNQLPTRGLRPNVRIYNMILGSLCQQGFVEDAKCLLIEMEKSCSPNSVTYNVIIQGLLKNNDIFKTMQFMEEMCKRGFFGDTGTISMLLDRVQGQNEDDIFFCMIKKILPKGLREGDAIG